jgi:hypothetical protein
MLCVACAVVVGRLAQPEKHPDSMDIVLQWLGGGLGFVVARIMLSRKLASMKFANNALSSHEHLHEQRTRDITRGSSENAS